MSKKISKYRDHFMTVIQFHFLKIYLLHSIELFPQFLNQYKKEIYFSNKNIVAFVKWSLLDRVLFKYFLKHLSQERQYRKCWRYIWEAQCGNLTKHHFLHCQILREIKFADSENVKNCHMDNFRPWNLIMVKLCNFFF